MAPFQHEVGEIVLVAVLYAVPREVSETVRLDVADFIRKPVSTKELYNYCNQIASLKEGVSNYVRVLCDVKAFYAPPDKDELKLIDIHKVKKLLDKGRLHE